VAGYLAHTSVPGRSSNQTISATGPYQPKRAKPVLRTNEGVEELSGNPSQGHGCLPRRAGRYASEFRGPYSHSDHSVKRSASSRS